MSFDPHSYLRVLAIRHSIAREPGDTDGAGQARRAFTAELREIGQFVARGRDGVQRETIRHYLASARDAERFTRTAITRATEIAAAAAPVPDTPATLDEPSRAKTRDVTKPAPQPRPRNAHSHPRRSRAKRRGRR